MQGWKQSSYELANQFHDPKIGETSFYFQLPKRFVLLLETLFQIRKILLNSFRERPLFKISNKVLYLVQLSRPLYHTTDRFIWNSWMEMFWWWCFSLKYYWEKRIFKFLIGLNKFLGDIPSWILGTKPLPSLREAFVEVRREERVVSK